MEAMPGKPAMSLPAQSREMLDRSLQHSHPTVRLRAIDAAARLKTPAVLPLIEPLLTDPDPRVSNSAAGLFQELASQPGPELPPAFAGLRSPELRIRAITLLARTPETATAIPNLYDAEPATEVRLAMIHALSRANDPSATRVILRALADPSAEVRQVAGGLIRHHPEWLQSEAADDARRHLEHSRERLPSEAQEAVGAWIERLRAAQVRQKLHASGMAALLCLTTALRSSSPVIRQAAAEACQRSEDSRAIAALIQALSDKDADTRHAAGLALWHLGWKAETEEQFASLLVALGQFEDAAKIGTTATRALLNVVESDAPKQQAKAIEALARMEAISAMPSLARLLNSPHYTVQQAAARALKKMEWVPPTPEAAAAHAIALHDWAAAAATGAPAVTPLMSALKSVRGNEADTAAITCALATLDDVDAAAALAGWARDGEVAQAAVAALRNILNSGAPRVSREALRTLAGMPDATQFTFGIDEQYGRPVRTGFESINLEDVRAAAAHELTRREAARKEEPSA